MSTERAEAFLYTQAGVNENMNTAAREELNTQGISFKEIDLTGHELDEEWPDLPVISSRAAFVGSFRNREALQANVSVIKP